MSCLKDPSRLNQQCMLKATSIISFLLTFEPDLPSNLKEPFVYNSKFDKECMDPSASSNTGDSPLLIAGISLITKS